MTSTRAHRPVVRRLGASAAAAALIALSFAASPAQADEVTYQATCSLGGLSAPQDFVLSGDVEAGPVEAGGPVAISGLTYSDQYGEGYHIWVTVGGTVIDLGTTAGPDGGTKSTTPVDATITAPGTGGSFEVAPTSVRLAAPGSDFEIDCPVTTSPGPIGVVEVTAAATTSTSTTAVATTAPSSTSTSTPGGGTGSGGTGSTAPGAVPVSGSAAYTG
ncbi:MAG TPA: hypothetical protein VNS19_07150 [Acidimicrobiales bacterium]|jgi:hypothetical protein|nr:hypothetical protein [Acidimicrobiales bacterium]